MSFQNISKSKIMVDTTQESLCVCLWMQICPDFWEKLLAKKFLAEIGIHKISPWSSRKYYDPKSSWQRRLGQSFLQGRLVPTMKIFWRECFETRQANASATFDEVSESVRSGPASVPSPQPIP
jgi:hypothetical protein